MSTQDFACVLSAPDDSERDSILGGALSSCDPLDQTDGIQSDVEVNAAAIESLESVSDRGSVLDEAERSGSEGTTCERKDGARESLECDEDEAVDVEVIIMDEEETPAQEEYEESISEEQSKETYEEHEETHAQEEYEESISEEQSKETYEEHEETPAQEEYEESISEEQSKETYEEHAEESDVVENKFLKKFAKRFITREEAALRSIHRPPVLDVNQELAPGKEFADYDAFMSAVYRYSKAHGVTYVTGFSKTVLSRNKDCRKAFSEKLRFANLSLRCKFGGGPRPSIACVRLQKLSCKMYCPSVLTVMAQRNPDRLRVTKFIEDHNHEFQPPISSECEARSSTSPLKRGQKKKAQDRRSATPTSSAKSLKMTSSPYPSYKSSGNSRVPMVVLRPLDGMTALSKLTASSGTSMSPGSWQSVALRTGQSVPVRRLSREAMRTTKPRLSGEHPYASSAPVSSSDKVIDITDDDDGEGSNVELSKAVARVNEAWKCVYRVLEEDHTRLRAEAERLRADNKRLCARCANCGSKR